MATRKSVIDGPKDYEPTFKMPFRKLEEDEVDISVAEKVFLRMLT